MSQSEQEPVFDRQGNEIGVRSGNTVRLSDGSIWSIVDGNVYAGPHDDFIGQIHNKAICGFTGEVLYSFGEPISDLDENDQ